MLRVRVLPGSRRVTYWPVIVAPHAWATVASCSEAPGGEGGAVAATQRVASLSSISLTFWPLSFPFFAIGASETHTLKLLSR